ncbi:MBL fold metallo-hydrolase [Paucibacter sp. APW11]|uniref:MBL fold metallo-hydrolase n=1 Tax=Roseateles aquae TaxID=3077235 RepID=A0ABU3PAG4_9BURK|nr:MBL fold metallo-hydrolase [Paucibacter sp. APW11]MDT8999579.1 MBL fold metallo-hydrolase [Paucibacter sp. APW11]
MKHLSRLPAPPRLTGGLLPQLLSVCLALAGLPAAAAEPAPSGTTPVQQAASPSARWQLLSLAMSGERLVGEQAPRPSQAEVPVPVSQTLLLDRDGRFRLVTGSQYPGPIQFSFLQTGGPDGSATVDLLKWRNGTEILRKNAEAARADLAELQFLAPALLLELAASQGLRPAAGASQLDFKDLAGRPAQLLLDAGTGEPRAAISASRRYDYADFQPLADGLRQPRRISESRAEKTLVRWQLQAQTMAGPLPGVFDLPAGYVEATAASGLRATPIGPGCYRVDGAASSYHSAFSIGERGIVVYDAPVSVAEANQVRAQIAQLAPGRPVSHVLISHTHRDHIAGLPAFASEQLQILAGPEATQAVRRQHGEALAARVSELREVNELDLGDRRIRLMPLANSHANESLVAFDSACGALFQGDLFYIPDVGPVPAAFAMSKDLDQLIQREALPVQLIVGVHGRSGTLAELRQSLKLADTLRKLQPEAHKH